VPFDQETKPVPAALNFHLHVIFVAARTFLVRAKTVICPASTVRKKQMFDPELESFKTSIDLRAYAASHGYALDREESWRGSAVMRHANGDKIIIKRDSDNHYVYFSVRDDADHRTIIDFVQNRLRLNFGAARKELRPWLGRNAEALSYSPLVPASKDRMCVETTYARTKDARSHPYLENERKIPGSIYWRRGRFCSRDRPSERYYYDGSGSGHWQPSGHRSRQHAPSSLQLPAKSWPGRAPRRRVVRGANAMPRQKPRRLLFRAPAIDHR
jgi:hypothetical protein